MKQNYQLMLDRKLSELTENSARPSLLLHACCAPCSSYVLEYLSKYFSITLFFFNPNISAKAEYDTRYEELLRLVSEMGLESSVKTVNGDYQPERFFAIAKGLEQLPEGGERCKKCYALRLEEAAKKAALGGFDYFTTTLSISPHKNAEWLNTIGASLSQEYGVPYLFSDFKKRGGYLRSCELSEKYGLYRQDFCGCVYSKAERDKRLREAEIEKEKT